MATGKRSGLRCQIADNACYLYYIWLFTSPKRRFLRITYPMSPAHSSHPDPQAATQTSSYRHIWALSWPIMLSNITLPLVGAVDTAMMGHLPDPAFIGGVALGAVVLDFYFMFFSFLKMSTTGLAAQAYGRGDHKETQLILARAASIGLAGGLLFLLGLPLILLLATSALQADPAVEQMMREYVAIRSLSVPAALLSNTLLGWLFAHQAMRIGMFQLLVVNLLNIALNILFVVGLGWQIAGVAWATVGAQWVGLVMTLMVMWAYRRSLRLESLRFTKAAFSYWADWLQFFSLSRDITIRTVILFIVQSSLIIQASTMDVLSLAAMQITLSIFALISFGLDGFAHAAEALVGEAIGKKHLTNLQLVIRRSTYLAGLVAILMSALLYLCEPYLLSLYTTQAEIQQAVHQIWIWILLIPPASMVAFQMDGVFIGAAQGREMRNSISLAAILYIACLMIAPWIVPGIDGLDALMLAFIIYLAARGVILWRRLPVVMRQAGAAKDRAPVSGA